MKNIFDVLSFKVERNYLKKVYPDFPIWETQIRNEVKRQIAEFERNTVTGSSDSYTSEQIISDYVCNVYTDGFIFGNLKLNFVESGIKVDQRFIDTFINVLDVILNDEIPKHMKPLCSWRFWQDYLGFDFNLSRNMIRYYRHKDTPV